MKINAVLEIFILSFFIGPLGAFANYNGSNGKSNNAKTELGCVDTTTGLV